MLKVNNSSKQWYWERRVLDYRASLIILTLQLYNIISISILWQASFLKTVRTLNDSICQKSIAENSLLRVTRSHEAYKTRMYIKSVWSAQHNIFLFEIYCQRQTLAMCLFITIINSFEKREWFASVYFKAILKGLYGNMLFVEY